MTDITREEVLANRKRWVEFLQKPGRKKAEGLLDMGDGGRCCLGHGCYALGIKRMPSPLSDGVFYYEGQADAAPASFRKMVGLIGGYGELADGGMALAEMNDKTDMTPQQIGAWIEARITGDAPDSPFLPLSNYLEGNNQ